MVTSERLQLVFLMGKQRSGKDTVADLLCEHFNFTKVSLASKLKEIAEDLFFMKEKDRKLLTELGQAMRGVRASVWIDYLLNSINNNDNSGERPRLVIPDVRFRNEYDTFKSLGGIPVHVYAPYEVRRDRAGYHDGFEDDISENEELHNLAKIKIDNSGTLPELFMSVYDFGKDFEEGRLE